jgi:hypothetical protein
MHGTFIQPSTHSSIHPASQEPTAVCLSCLVSSFSSPHPHLPHSIPSHHPLLLLTHATQNDKSPACSHSLLLSSTRSCAHLPQPRQLLPHALSRLPPASFLADRVASHLRAALAGTPTSTALRGLRISSVGSEWAGTVVAYCRSASTV